MPLISVIVPVYNVEEYVVRCIDSILAQSLADFELILVDDGSTDKSGSICDSYAKIDKRVISLHQRNRGPGAARNTGIDWAIDNSDSKWVSFIDSDDWVHRHYLKALLHAAVEHNVMISMCPLKETNSIIQDNIEIPVSRRVSVGEAYVYNSTSVAAWAGGRLYNKEVCFANIRFPVDRLWEDLATTYKLFWLVEHVALVESELYYYYVNPQSIMRRKWNPKKLDELIGYEEQLQFFKDKCEPEIYIRLANTYINYTHAHYYYVKESDLPEKEKIIYERILRKKLGKALLKYGRKMGIVPQNNPGLYKIAYPNLIEVYWFARVIANKVGGK